MADSTIHNFTDKATPVDTDELAGVQSPYGAGDDRKFTFANVKAFIKAYYDAVSSTLTNKSVSLTDNTVTGTKAEFDTAVSDGNIMYDGDPASNVTVAVVGTPTYTTVQHAINLGNSSGLISGCSVTDAGGGTIDIAAGTGWIKATDSDVAEILFFDFPANNGVATTTDSVEYVKVEYNAGTPRSVLTSSEDWDIDTSFPIAKTVNEGDVLHILCNPWQTGDAIGNIIERFQSEGEIVRDNRLGGLILSVTGTRNIAVTAGQLWSRLNEFPISAIDTSVTGTVEAYWRSGASAWTDADVSQYPITQFNQLSTNTLETIPNNRYFNWWIYAEADDSEISLRYPTETYVSSAGAEAEAAPSTLPPHMSENAILIGRIVCKQGVDAPVEVQSAFDTTFTAALAADHGNLAGLTDDDHTQYALRASFIAGAGALTGPATAGVAMTLGNTETITGTKTLGENTSIALDPALSADGKYSGITIAGTGGDTIAFGDLVTLDKDDSRWEKVDISVAAAATGDARGLLGIAVTSSTDGNPITVLLQGTIRADANFPALTIGAAVYASTTGDVVVTQPSTTDYVIRIVGSALTANEIYFNPDNSWITAT